MYTLTLLTTARTLSYHIWPSLACCPLHCFGVCAITKDVTNIHYVRQQKYLEENACPASGNPRG